FGTVTTEDDGKGYITTKYSGFDPKKQDDLVKEVDLVLGQDVNGMTNEAKSILADTLKMNPDDMTDEQFKTFKQNFANEILNKFNTTTGTDIDYAASQGQQRVGIAQQELALRQRQQKLAEEKADKPVNTVSVRTDEKG